MSRDDQTIRHTSRERGFEPAHGDDVTISEVAAHFERHIGPVGSVLHELISDRIHLDVHRIEPGPGRPFLTFFTTGMSDLPMHPPAEYGDRRFAELMIKLTPDWDTGVVTGKTDAGVSPEKYWPLRMLKTIARLPHEYQSWIDHGHTIPNGDPPMPFAANTEFCCGLVTLPLEKDPEFWTAELSDGRVVRPLSVIPLFREEVELKLTEGTGALFERFDRYGVNDIIRLDRPNVAVRRKKWFGLF